MYTAVNPDVPFDVALVADMCVDVIVSGNVRPLFGQREQLVDDYLLEIGGSANVFACQAAKLGLRTTVMGRVGDDAFGEFLCRRLVEEGVDVSGVIRDHQIRTGLGITLTEPTDRAILTYLGSIDATLPNNLPVAPDRLCRHWHVASLFLLGRLRTAWPEFLQRVRACRLTTSLDPNWDPAEQWLDIDELIKSLDLFMPNEAELIAITGESDIIAGARKLSRRGPIVVVKRGADGALAVRGERVVELPRIELKTIDNVVDSVGAGDCFDAGFLSCWLRGGSLGECLSEGHSCATASLRCAGGIQGQLQPA